MKKVIIGIAMVACLTLGFATCGSDNWLSARFMPGMKIEKTFASPCASDGPALSKQPAQEASIFSWTAILYLTSGIIGIVVFRRNACA